MAISLATRVEVVIRCGNACFYCKRKSSPEVVLEIDHVIPVAKGGNDRIENLVAACKSCNIRKRDSILPGLILDLGLELADFVSVYSHGLSSDGILKGSPIDVEHVVVCRDWLRRFGSKTPRIRRERGSYGYKHVVEKWVHSYVSNGAFIRAAIEEGYRIEACVLGSPNAYFDLYVAPEHNPDAI